tara:strand:- start:4171 stop:5658 length:1488 start_codon:yes stop_codon:yes gene_type:complete
MSDLSVKYEDSVDIKVECERGIAKELSDYFTFKVPGHQYMPSYKNKMWDGQIKLYNIYAQTLYAGLLDYVIRFAEDRNYSIEVDKELKEEKKKINLDAFLSLMKLSVSGKEIEPYEHQKTAINYVMHNDRCLLLSPTGSGKSLIIYCLMRHYLNILPEDKKVLIIVPTTSLVTQMLSDFEDYSKKDSWGAKQNCHAVMAGKDKDYPRKRVIISTWQSIYKMRKPYFDKFGAVFGDECHLFKAKSLTSIMTKLKDCPYRVGTTGTLDGTQTHKLVIEGLFGPVFDVTSTKELMNKDLLSKLKIDTILLKYSDEDKKEIKRAKYQDEMDWLVKHKGRNDFISDMTINLKGNTLVLFQYVEKHGKVIHSIIEEKAKDRKVFFVHGGTDVETREKVRQITEKEEDAIIVASYGTFSTGISIRRLHNIIFASPSKSRVRVLQSIGRQLRKSEHKDVARLYDIGDDLSWKSWKNHTLRHFLERIKIYESEKFDFASVMIRI